MMGAMSKKSWLTVKNFGGMADSSDKHPAHMLDGSNLLAHVEPKRAVQFTLDAASADETGKWTVTVVHCSGLEESLIAPP
jgi:hypothetical protein